MSHTWFLFIRHGETDWNIQKRMQGHTEIPLNAMGKRQAKKIAQHLKHFGVDILYSSPLTRAHQTAVVIHKYHPIIPLLTSDALKERAFGELEGKTYEEIWQTYPELLFEQSWNYPALKIPGGERLADVYNRVQKFLDEVLRKDKGKTIVVVSHGVTIRCMICSLLQLPLEQGVFLDLENTSFSLIKQPEAGIAELHFLNKTIHLDNT